MTSNPRIMGMAFTNSPAVAAAAWAIAAAVRPKPCCREDVALVPMIDISLNTNQLSGCWLGICTLASSEQNIAGPQGWI